MGNRQAAVSRRRFLGTAGSFAVAGPGSLLPGCVTTTALDPATIGDTPLKDRSDKFIVGTHIDREFMFHRPYRDTLVRDFELVIEAAPVLWGGASNGRAAAATTARPTASVTSPTNTGCCCAVSP